jgi:hypothetical protein
MHKQSNLRRQLRARNERYIGELQMVIAVAYSLTKFGTLHKVRFS